MANEMKQVRFRVNNGRVMRRINILRHEFIDLETVQKVVERDSVSASEFLDCINFLHEEGYIHLHTLVGDYESSLANHAYNALKAKLTGRGIRLMNGDISDSTIEV